uniref:Coiled-coil domain-containing protein 60 n=1 Tax=Pyxicephalus adspersus TaxID=30357 RepID=A0AAV3A9Q1_PYXAD|nr:TPA: hypothetical protein GDO54_014204 [Pyxicephalus adspersus]
MPGNAGHPSDPKSYVVIQPLPIPSQKGLKIQARSATHYNCWVPCRDEIFRANYYRRQKQLSQQGYNSPNYKPYEELGQPLFLEAKKLILHSLGQDELIRRLISSVKQGRRYFHMLHQEEEASKLKVQEKQCQLQERNKTEPRPYRDSDDSSADEEEISTSVHKTGFFLTQPEEQQKKQKRSMSRPFTPMHNCLLSKQVLKADPNFRFSGLSSAVTPSMGSVSSLIPSSDEMPVSSDGPQDGGDDIESTVNSSVHTPGKLSKEEDEEPLSDYMQTLLKMIGESVSKELDEEESQSKYKLKIDISSTEIKEKVATNDQIFPKSITQRPKSSPASVMSPTSLFIKRKSNMPSEMKKLFFETADEAEIYLHDKVEAMERRRQEFNTKKYRSLNTISNFRQDLEKMRKANCHIKEEKNYTDTKNWFVVLQSRIPEDMKNNQIKKILEKLEKLEEKNFVRIRPHSFLKVLAGLRNWELCSPDICVAIEFVREHLVQMPSEDYTTWLQTKLTSSSSHRVQSAPPQR